MWGGMCVVCRYSCVRVVWAHAFDWLCARVYSMYACLRVHGMHLCKCVRLCKGAGVCICAGVVVCAVEVARIFVCIET